MHVRVITFTGAKNINEGVAYVRDKVIENLNEQRGYRGLTVSADRPGEVLGILTLWETEEDRDASERALANSRQKGLEIIGGSMSVENFEQLVEKIIKPPVAGSPLTVTPITMNPSKVDDNLAYFKSDVLPQIIATAGCRAVRNMMNRQTGHGIVGVAWEDKDAMTAAAAAAASRREGAVAKGVNFGEVSIREIVLASLR
ncbi:MAG TPA: hypothetical protein VNE42_04580 [Acidimicrobiales bacterium]|nr:hypothetical protein [Acidimicrobiales bacterium]